MKGIGECIDIQCKDYFTARKQENGMIELCCQLKPEQLTILSSILYDSDFTDLDQIEDKIYAFGRTVKTKDELGRVLFVFMASIIRGAGVRRQRGN